MGPRVGFPAAALAAEKKQGVQRQARRWKGEDLVRARGLEPPILSEPDPKSGASAIPPRARGGVRCRIAHEISSSVQRIVKGA